MVVLLLWHEPVMFAIGVTYVLSGPARLVHAYRREIVGGARSAEAPGETNPTPTESNPDV